MARKIALASPSISWNYFRPNPLSITITISILGYPSEVSWEAKHFWEENFPILKSFNTSSIIWVPIV